MKVLLNFGLRQDLFGRGGWGVERVTCARFFSESNTGSEKRKALAQFLFSMDPLPYLSLNN